jgi:hypothetical protein
MQSKPLKTAGSLSGGDNMTVPFSRRTMMLGATASGIAMPWVSKAQGLKTEYKVSVVGNRPITMSEGAFRWAEIVAQKSGGRINMKVYPGSALVGGDQTRELVAMRQDVIDMTVSSTINLSPQVKELTLFSMPFLMPASTGRSGRTCSRYWPRATWCRWPGARTAFARFPIPRKRSARRMI